jgi:hypothetical protein
MCRYNYIRLHFKHATVKSDKFCLTVMLVHFNCYVQQENIERLRYVIIVFSFTARQPASGQGFLCVVPSQSRFDTPHSAGLLWTCDRPDVENTTCHTSLTTLTRDRHPCPTAVFEPAIRVSERPQTHALDGDATWIGSTIYSQLFLYNTSSSGTEDLHLQSELFLPAVTVYLQTSNTDTWRPSA